MSFIKHLWLQFFADGAAGGADGGDGADSGVNPADAGQDAGVITDDADRIADQLNIPQDKRERFNKAQKKRAAAQPETKQAAPEAQKGDPWDEFFKDPQNKQRLQDMLSERGRKATEERQRSQEMMDKLGPMFRLFSDRYGIEAKDGLPDIDAITAAVTNDDAFFEDKAFEKGENVEKTKSDWKQELEAEQRKKVEREQQLRQHFMGMQQQGQKLKEMFPDFDLQKELQDPEFLRRTSPEGGLSVEEAYYSLHHNDILRAQLAALTQKVMADVARTQPNRPRENGSAAATPVVASPNFATMSRDERRAYIKAKYPPR